MNKIPLLLLAGFLANFGRLSAADAVSATPPTASSTSDKPVTYSPETVKQSEILAGYLKISAALAADNLTDAKTAAAALAILAEKGGQKDVAAQATAVSKGKDIAAVRASFKTLSTTVAALVKNDKGYIVMHCPMASADWVQASKEVKNPYYGKAMLTCGAPKTAN